jgi:hypothetical protein
MARCERDVEDAEVRGEVLEERYGKLGIKTRIRVDRERHTERHRRLPQEFGACRDALAVAPLDLAVVVDESQHPVARGDTNHDPNEAIVEIRPEQYRHQQREQDQQSTHRRCAFFALVVRADLADRLTHTQTLERANQRGTHHERDEQRCKRGCTGPEGDVAEHVERAVV